MGRPKQIRSRLVTFTVTATDSKTQERRQWEIQLQGNRIPEEKREWLAMAHTGGFRDIRLARRTLAQKAQENRIQTKAEIAAEGLAILDKILASRKS